MPVTKTIMAVGSWSLTLSPQTPRNIIDSLQYFGHIVVATGRQDPRVAGNSLFNSGRYTGVITGLDFQSLKQGRGPVISGDGLETWLGTPNGVGPVIENIASFTSALPSTVFNTLRPAAVGAGTNYSLGTSATYTGAFVWKTPRDSLTSFCQQISTGPAPAQTVEWRVNNNCTLDTGPVSSLYVTTPVTAIVAKNDGVDMRLRGLAGTTELIEDVKDYTTRVVVLASGSGASTAVGTANAADVGAATPYTDFFGNPVAMTRMVSASSVSSFNATASAQAALIPYTSPRDQVKLASSEYDIMGQLNVGDYTFVYDPDSGLVDTSNEAVFRGQRINPVKLRVIELTWPVVEGMTVAYRDLTGHWYDLTDYLMWETGDTSVVVGGFNRSLVPTSEPVGPRPIPDTTVPGVPAFTLPFSTTSYQSSSDGRTRSQIQLSWTTPTNTDGTTMTDLDHYEIQYRPDLTISSVNPTWSGLNSGGYTWNALQSSGAQWSQIFPVGSTQWKVTFVSGGTNTLLVQELTPGVTYDFQIRAVDTAQPPNRSAWSATTTFQAGADTLPPPTPDPPTVASSMLAVQISWDCGRASGGTFNQAVDLHHIEVHGSYDPLFTPVAGTKLGNLPANIGNINGQIPVVGSFTIPANQPPAQQMFIKVIAVDETGNKSSPSASAGSTAKLISDVYITDVTADKITAGTIRASLILGGLIGTALDGQRVTMDSTGFHAYDSTGSRIFDVNSSSPVLTLGRNSSGSSITMDTSQTNPVITMSDGVNLPSQITFSSNSFSGNVGAQVDSGAYTPNNPLSSLGFMQLSLVDDQGTTGLRFVDSATGSVLSAAEVKSDQSRVVCFNTSGTVLGSYRVGEDGLQYAVGRYLNNFMLSGTDLWGTGEASVSGFSSATVSLGVTLATFGAPIPAVRDLTGGTTTQGAYISTSGTTSFTAAWHTTTPTHMWYYLMRLDA